MNTTPTEKPEAIWLADALDELDAQFTHRGMCGEAAAELRRQHAEIARLTDENEALKAVVSDAVTAEREACALIAADSDHVVDVPGWHSQLGDAVATARQIEAAIRARGSQ